MAGWKIHMIRKWFVFFILEPFYLCKNFTIVMSVAIVWGCSYHSSSEWHLVIFIGRCPYLRMSFIWCWIRTWTFESVWLLPMSIYTGIIHYKTKTKRNCTVLVVDIVQYISRSKGYGLLYTLHKNHDWVWIHVYSCICFGGFEWPVLYWDFWTG